MKEKRIFIFCVLGISLIFLSVSTYSYYNLIIEADFLISGTKIEAKDWDNLLLDKKSLAGVVPSPYRVSFFLEGIFSRPDLSFSVLTPQIGPTSSVLRC
jgi:hypothetical protein